MAENFFTKIIDRSIERIANKTHSVSFSAPTQSGLLQIINSWTSGGKKYVDLAKFLEWYETHPLVFEVIDNISQSVSKIPLRIENSKGETIENSEILKLLPIDLREKITASQESCGNGFLYFVDGVGGLGGVVDFWVASQVTITTSIKTGAITKYQYNNPYTGTTTTVQGDALKYVLHLKNPTITTNLPVEIGLSKLQPMKDVVESSKEKFKADTALVKNGGVKGILSNNSEIPLLEDDRKKQQALFDAATSGADKFGGVHVTANKVAFTPLGANAEDLKIIQGISESLRRLASAYHLSSVLFNDVANSKFDNMEEAIKQAYINCYIPTAEKIYTPIFKWLSELLTVDEIPFVDKTQIEVIKASTNKTAMILSAFDVTVQRMLVGQLTNEEARLILEMKPLTATQTPIGMGGTNTTGNGQGT